MDRAERERYARQSRDAAEMIVRYAQESGSKDPSEAIEAFESATGGCKIPGREHMEDDTDCEPHGEFIEAFAEFARDLGEILSKAKEDGPGEVEGMLAAVGEEFGDEDPLAKLKGSRCEREQDASEFRQWMAKVARHAARRGYTSDQIAEALEEMEDGR